MQKQHEKNSEMESIRIPLYVACHPQVLNKANHALIEDPNKTWHSIQTLIINKNTSLLNSAGMFALQQSSSRTSADSTDSRFTNIE